MKNIIILIFGLLLSSLVLAIENHSQHTDMNHAKMDHSQHKETKHNMSTIDCSDPIYTVEEQCKGKVSEHSQHKDRKHSEMDSHNMNHSTMNHNQHQEKSISVSDGSTGKNIPVPFPGAMHMEDDPLLTKVMIDQLEMRQVDGSDNPIVLEAEAWIGKDINKLWLKADIERVGSRTEEAELQMLYSRAIEPYWDLQVGIRKDFKPKNREWLAIGVKGIAPYFFETDAAIFIADKGRTAARISSEYEMMITQKAVLSPEIGLNFYGKDDSEMGIGSGLSSASVGLRLRYEINREFAPYIGLHWSRKFGKTADFARNEGEKIENTQVVVGVRFWF